MSSYEWGDLKADPRQLVERYFDAFLDAGGRRGRRLERCRPYGKLRTQFNARRLATTRTGGDRAAEHWMREDGAVVTSDLARLDRDIRLAASGSVQEYAQVLERAVAACAVDPAAAGFLDELELHSEVADTYDGLGRVEDALRHADVLADRGYACTPDPRCRRAEILTRNGRLAEAAVVWDEVARHTPEDVWVFNNAGLEFGAVGEHELALSWLMRALELAVRTGDPERLVGQLRDLRATSLTALGREHDELQTAPPRTAMACRCRFAWAWLAAEDYAELAERWPDLADSAVVQDENGRLVAHPEYCRRMEQRLRDAREAGVTRIRIAPIRWLDFSRWRADAQADEDDPAELRARYAAHLCQDPSQVIVWPPGRNPVCWCGSARKYKKCCAAPDTGGLR